MRAHSLLHYRAIFLDIYDDLQGRKKRNKIINRMKTKSITTNRTIENDERVKIPWYKRTPNKNKKNSEYNELICLEKFINGNWL